MDNKTSRFIEYKALLFTIAYNMLGNVEAAEDIVQDTFLKWTKTPADEIKHMKAYLVKMVTNACINFMNSARLKREEYVGIWLPEPLVNYDLNKSQAQIESYHALSIGILVLLEKLTPQERAIFLLKEVFAYDYHELAEIFDKTEDNCRQIFKRAKDNLGKGARRYEVDLKAHEKMLHSFLRAVSEGNVDDLVGLLKEDIVFFADGGGKSFEVNGQRLTATLNPIYGREHVSRLLMKIVPKLEYIPDFNREITIVNGLPSVVSYSGSSPISILSLEGDGDKIMNIYIQTNPEKLKRFTKEN